MQKFEEKIEETFRAHLEGHPFWLALKQENPVAFHAVRETLLVPGKRVRPLLFCTACRAAGLEPFPNLAPVALALELAHSFILVHDDIVDRSAMRRGRLTLPAKLRQLFAQNPSDGFTGDDFALVTGDLLYTLAIESLLQAEATDAQKTEAVRLFTRAAFDTGRGALLEMRAAQTPLAELTVEEIEKIYALKTGTYTFTLPLQLAAVFSRKSVALAEEDNPWDLPKSGQSSESAESISTLGKHAGIAFQLRNDQKDLADDLRDGRRTWALVHADSEAAGDAATKAAVEHAQAEHAHRALEFIQVPELAALVQRALS